MYIGFKFIMSYKIKGCNASGLGLECGPPGSEARYKAGYYLFATNRWYRWLGVNYILGWASLSRWFWWIAHRRQRSCLHHMLASNHGLWAVKMQIKKHGKPVYYYLQSSEYFSGDKLEFQDPIKRKDNKKE